MKQRTTYLIILLFLICKSLTAQIILSSAPAINNVGCKHSVLGSIHLAVKSLHPPYSFKWSNGQTTAEISELEPGDYSVEIKDNNGADTTLTFSIIQLNCALEPEIFFSPNGDGYNDFWDIAYSSLFPDALIMVYNKFGQLVFRHVGLYDSDKRWDGTDLTGATLPVSTYFFVVFDDKSERKNVKKGTVSIIR